MLLDLDRLLSTDTRARRSAAPGRLAWALPLLVWLVVRYASGQETLLIQALLGTGVVLVVSRRPDRAILALVIGYPFNTVVLSYLYSRGVPKGLVSNASYWKEAMVAGCAVAALRRYREGDQGLDWIDKVVAIYAGIVALYYLFPRLFVHPSGPYAIGPPTDSQALNLGIRENLLFLVLFVAVRHLELDARFRERFVRAVFTAGVVIAAVGLYEYWFSNSWNDLIVNTVQLPRFRVDVIGVFTGDPNDVRTYSNGVGSAIRIGSVFLDPLLFGAWLVPPLAIGIERLVRSARQPFLLVGSGVMTVALLLTQTRGALVGMLVVTVILLRPSPSRDVSARVQFIVVGAAALILLAPIAVSSGVVDRSVGSANGAEGSNQDHIERTRTALDQLLHEPLGRGLGTGPGLGARLDIATATNPENYYLQIGTQTGLVSGIVFVVIVFLVAGRLRRARDAPDVLTPSWRASFIALSLVCFVMGLWADPAIALLVWAGLGVVTAVRTDAPRHAALSTR